MSTIEKALAKQKIAQEGIASEIVENKTLPTEAATIKTENSTNNYSINDVLQLNKDELASRGFLIDDGTRKNIKDEFRQIKRKLLNNAFGASSKTLNNSNLVMVSSSKPNEGKTFISINLALSIALEQDKTVLLIDADVLRPSLNRELGFGQVPGLIEYLLGQKDNIPAIMYSTNIDKLKIIPAI